MTGNMMKETFNINNATFKPVKYLTPYSESYKGSGDITLVNGVRGSSNFSDGEWQGWNGTNLNLVIDLQQPTTIRKISVGSVQNPGAWIFFPKKVEFYISPDGVNFRFVAESDNDIAPLSPGTQLRDFTADFEPVTARYLQIIARNLGKCPPGTPGAGQPAWLFSDEVSVE
jgi:hexosaminidase